MRQGWVIKSTMKKECYVLRHKHSFCYSFGNVWGKNFVDKAEIYFMKRRLLKYGKFAIKETGTGSSK